MREQSEMSESQESSGETATAGPQVRSFFVSVDLVDSAGVTSQGVASARLDGTREVIGRMEFQISPFESDSRKSNSKQDRTVLRLLALEVKKEERRKGIASRILEETVSRLNVSFVDPGGWATPDGSAFVHGFISERPGLALPGAYFLERCQGDMELLRHDALARSYLSDLAKRYNVKLPKSGSHACGGTEETDCCCTKMGRQEGEIERAAAYVPSEVFVRGVRSRTHNGHDTVSVIKALLSRLDIDAADDLVQWDNAAEDSDTDKTPYVILNPGVACAIVYVSSGPSGELYGIDEDRAEEWGLIWDAACQCLSSMYSYSRKVFAQGD